MSRPPRPLVMLKRGFYFTAVFFCLSLDYSIRLVRLDTAWTVILHFSVNWSVRMTLQNMSNVVLLPALLWCLKGGISKLVLNTFHVFVNVLRSWSRKAKVISHLDWFVSIVKPTSSVRKEVKLWSVILNCSIQLPRKGKTRSFSLLSRKPMIGFVASYTTQATEAHMKPLAKFLYVNWPFLQAVSFFFSGLPLNVVQIVVLCVGVPSSVETVKIKTTLYDSSYKYKK